MEKAIDCMRDDTLPWLARLERSKSSSTVHGERTRRTNADRESVGSVTVNVVRHDRPPDVGPVVERDQEQIESPAHHEASQVAERGGITRLT
jgi:hypothetical protein